MKNNFLLASLIFILSCSPSLNEQTKNLVNGKNKWLMHFGNKDYSFTYKRRCFCTLNNREILIKVKNHKVVSASTKDNPNLKSKKLLSIKGQFNLILEMLQKQESKEWGSVKVEYHEKLGYPSKITYKSSRIDGSWETTITKVTLL